MAFPSIEIIKTDLTFIETEPDGYKALYAGNFDRGPINELFEIKSALEFKQTFGEPTVQNESDWFQIWNYFSYGNNSLYIMRISNSSSKCASIKISAEAGNLESKIIAKTPGSWGNKLTLKVTDKFEVYLKDAIMETLEFGEESDYVEIPENLKPGIYELHGGETIEPTNADIEEGFEVLYGYGELDVELILAPSQFANPAINLARKIRAMCVVNSEFANSRENAIYYTGSKLQTNLYTGKKIRVPITGDILGMRMFLINSEGFGVSHCRRTLNINNVISYDIPKNSKELYAKKVNCLIKGTTTYCPNSEICADGKQLTTHLIENRLIKDAIAKSNYFVFEFNDDFTRNDFKKKIAAVCEKYLSAGLISDYLVNCDLSNQNSSEPNAIYLDLYYKPVGIAESVKISLIATNSI